ncbi:alpha/beta hydrolase [Endozoicomonas sp. Mp262]|uniref:alpha/beta hydrolase n=1 Tax=Endozoicomonas sp. Mp262 TaxID=2919499 RepID=UPI0021D99BDF
MDIKATKESMPALDFSGRSMLPEHQAYNHYYGLGLETQIPGISHQFGYIDSGHYRLACHSYQPAKPKGTFFLLHGYYDHTGLFRHIIRYFLEQNYCVFVYDLPGHGLSSGPSATIPDFSIYSLLLENILNYCESNLPKPWNVYGQSTGCAIITDYLVNHSRQLNPPKFKQVVLSAPLVRPYLWNLGRVQLYLTRPFLKQIPRKFTDNCRDQSFLAFAREDPLAPRILPVEWVNAMDRWIRRIEKIQGLTVPVSPLILQGTHDKTIDATHNIAVLKRLYKGATVLYLEQARHHLPNELEATRTEYMEWLSSFL